MTPFCHTYLLTAWRVGNDRATTMNGNPHGDVSIFESESASTTSFDGDDIISQYAAGTKSLREFNDLCEDIGRSWLNGDLNIEHWLCEEPAIYTSTISGAACEERLATPYTFASSTLVSENSPHLLSIDFNLYARLEPTTYMCFSLSLFEIHTHQHT